MPADLHVHTVYSDGAYTPDDVITQCVARGVDTVAITDHDTVDGVIPTMEIGRRAGVRVVPGVEMTAYVDATEIHVIGLFLYPDGGGLRPVIEGTRRTRGARTERMVELLRRLDVDITLEDVLRVANGGVPGRPHVARALIRCGAVSSVAEAFDRYIGNDGPAHVPKHLLSPAAAAAAIHRGGGVSIVGHPGVGLPDDLVRQVIADGAQGIEVYHPLNSPEQERSYLRMAQELKVLVSGGSDSHGTLREATHIGAVRLDDGLVQQLEQRAREIRQRP